MGLAEKECIPCKGGVPALTEAEMAPLLQQLSGWKVVSGHHLEKEYQLKNFADALELTNRIGAEAEEQNHHPDLYLAWGKLGVQIWTHKIDGLTESDFVFAAKCDRCSNGTGLTPLRRESGIAVESVCVLAAVCWPSPGSRVPSPDGPIPDTRGASGRTPFTIARM